MDNKFLFVHIQSCQQEYATDPATAEQACRSQTCYQVEDVICIRARVTPAGTRYMCRRN
jgi:hypothetical protein